MTMFRNYMIGEWEAECAELRTVNFAPRWYIKMGFAGFNSPANNGNGYLTKDQAESWCLHYQNKGEKDQPGQGALKL